MLLQDILQQLDAELDRLHTLHTLVADLEGSSALLRDFTAGLHPEFNFELSPELKDLIEATPEPAQKRKRQTRKRAPAAEESLGTPEPASAEKPTKAQEPAAAIALRGPISSRPVMVSPQALARERSSRPAASPSRDNTPATQERSPESIVRNLSARWLTRAEADPA